MIGGAGVRGDIADNAAGSFVEIVFSHRALPTFQKWQEKCQLKKIGRLQEMERMTDELTNKPWIRFKTAGRYLIIQSVTATIG